ncbi:tRNA-splicing endonuclease subunit sen54 [Rhodotorula sphaerocarpa]
MEDDRPTAARVDLEEAEEDALPDWSDAAVLVPFIPKRGEKDFEPLAAADAFPPSSKEATLSQHQRTLLQDSRNALYTALSSGSRHHSSKGHNSFTWRPDCDGGRAVCDSGNAAYGVHFSNIGHFNQTRKTLELLPEEALYMVERGAIELWRDTEAGDRVPMSVQQSWSELLGHDDLTPERYQVYAFLRRLGYVVVRARSIAGAERAVTTKRLPLYRILIDTALRPLHSLRESILRLAATLRSWFSGSTVQQVRQIVTRSLKRAEGQASSLLSGRRWTSYDKMFAHLQVIPSGHDRPLPRGPLPHQPSVLTPLDKRTGSEAPADRLPSYQEQPYQTFFHVYKPVTKYKKSDPPEPDFRLVVINAVTTPMPDLFEFTAMFDSTPMPPPPPPPGSGPPRPPRNNQAGRPAPAAAPPPPPPTRLQAFLASIPLVQRLLPSLVAPAAPAAPPARKPTPYPRLKTGRRTILVAVVDNGTSSLLRFSEAEFAKIPWVGTPRSA